MNIKFAESDAEIKNCFSVMSQLRPHLSDAEFFAQVKRQIADGYFLAFLADAGAVKAVAGFRLGEMLFSGRYLYVDDLVTDERERSKGCGDALFDWLVNQAREQNCQQLRLDSGVQRFAAHRFYFRKRMQISAYNFTLRLNEV